MWYLNILGIQIQWHQNQNKQYFETDDLNVVY